MLRTIIEGEPDFELKLKVLAERSAALPEAVEAGARAIVADVRRRGDEALRELTRRFEGRVLSLSSYPAPTGSWLPRELRRRCVRL